MSLAELDVSQVGMAGEFLEQNARQQEQASSLLGYVIAIGVVNAALIAALVVGARKLRHPRVSREDEQVNEGQG